MLRFKPITSDTPLPEAFVDKTFRSYVDMANFADEHNLPDGEYYIFNSLGKNLLTRLRVLQRIEGGFNVEGRGNV